MQRDPEEQGKIMSEIGDCSKAKHQYFGGDQNSPLTPAQQKRFQGLEYFPENPALQFVLVVEQFPNDSRDLIQMATSFGDTAPHTRWGQSKFEVDGESVALTVYRSVGGDDFPSIYGREDWKRVLFRRPIFRSARQR